MHRVMRWLGPGLCSNRIGDSGRVSMFKHLKHCKDDPLAYFIQYTTIKTMLISMTPSEGSYSSLSPSHMETACFPSIPQTFASNFASKFENMFFSSCRTEELKDNKEQRRNAKKHTFWANLGTVDGSEFR